MRPTSSTSSSSAGAHQPGSASAQRQSRTKSRGFGALIEYTRNLDLLQIVGLLTLLSAILFPFGHWLFGVVSSLCFLTFILHPTSLRRPWFWFTLALAGTLTIVLIWERVDNHKYLLVYWTWVLFVVHLFSDPEQQNRILRFNARFFLCLIFLAASAQKAASPSYRSGEMFEHYIYVDPRFSAFGKLVGVDPAVGDGVKRRINYLRNPFAEVEGDDIRVPGSDRARMIAIAMTWWDFGLQFTIGALLLFGWRRTDQLAHILLLFFIFTTYIPAPVFGFGWILAVLGFVLAKENFPRIAPVYLICFFAIMVYELPWREWVLKS